MSLTNKTKTTDMERWRESEERDIISRLTALHSECEQRRDTALAYAGQCIARAVECGKILVQVKEQLGHGFFLNWLEIKAPFISQRTAYNYMTAAKRYGNLDRVEIEKLSVAKDLYQRAGLLPEGGEVETVAGIPKDDPARYTLSVDRIIPKADKSKLEWLRGWFESGLEKVNVRLRTL